MRSFVTGGSGFVGRALIARLSQAGHDVRALARSDAAARAVEAAGAQAVRGDLDDVAALRAGMQGCTWVFHSAAKVEQAGRRDDFVRVNVDGTQHVLDAARAAMVKRVVHISTEAVLCGRPIVDVDETAARPAHPVGLYAETKGLAEDRVRAANRDGLETVIVRPRFIWGRGDTTLLRNFVEASRRGVYAWIGGGRHRSSTCHVRNVCEGAMLAAERGRPGEVYFLTDGEPVQFREFVTRMVATQGVALPSRSLPHWLARLLAALMVRTMKDPPLTPMTVRLIGETVTVRDDKARRELGYRGSVSIEEGLRELSEDARAPSAGAAESRRE
jgi:nucleoside-diphosphate-sugar epimerase